MRWKEYDPNDDADELLGESWCVRLTYTGSESESTYL